jgi:hydroxymethylglutaryl-CoA lyase
MRFDSAMGGLGGCPFAQDQLVGNVPTEEVLRALRQRGVKTPLEGRLSAIAAMNIAISNEFADRQIAGD